MKIGIVQPDISLGKPRKNIEKMEKLIDELFSIDVPDIIVLPELWVTGYDYNTLYENVFTDKEVAKLLQKWVEKYPALWIPGSFPVKEEDKIYNRAYAISPEGKFLAKYDKIHLFGPMSEKRYFTPGNEIVVFEHKDLIFGLSICYDLRFPELFRILTLKDAKVIFLPTEWPAPRMKHFKTLMRARAIENQVFMVSANRVGKDSMSEFTGESRVVDPWGEDVCYLGEDEGVKVCTLDFSLLEKVRDKIPVLSDRREDLYNISTD